jgi:hypothetical protein
MSPFPLAWLFALGAKLLTSALESAATSLGSVVGTALGGVLTRGPGGSERRESLVTLQQNRQVEPAVAVQNSVVAAFRAAPSYHQEAEAALQTQRPADWSWVQQFSVTMPADYDWTRHFAETLPPIFHKQAEGFQRKYGLSDKQTAYERDFHCPISGFLTSIQFYRVDPASPEFASAIKMKDRWSWGYDLDLYATTLRKGDFVQCAEGHRWWVFAADANRPI